MQLNEPFTKTETPTDDLKRRLDDSDKRVQEIIEKLSKGKSVYAGEPVYVEAKAFTPPVKVKQELRSHLVNVFSRHLEELEKIFISKNKDYGPKNISVQGDKHLSLLGVLIRSNDKLQRALNLVANKQEPNNESIEDTLKDLANYAIIALMVHKDEWEL